MGKKITVAVFCGVIGFGIILTIVGVMLGGGIGSYGYQDGQVIYSEGGQQVRVVDVPAWASRIASRAANGHLSVASPPTAPEAPQAPAPFSAGELQELDIEVGAGYVAVVPGDEFGLTVDGPMEYTSHFENGVWQLTADPPGNITTRQAEGRTHFWHNGEDITTTFTFTVPAGFHMLGLDIDMGEAYVNGLRLESLACSTQMGAITLSEISADNADLTVAMGGIEATGFTADNCELQCEMGSIDIEGSVSGQFDATCNMGSIYAYLEEPADFGWDIKADLGSASVGGRTVSGLDGKADGGNASASAFYTLESGMGSIEVEFK